MKSVLDWLNLRLFFASRSLCLSVCSAALLAFSACTPARVGAAFKAANAESEKRGISGEHSGQKERTLVTACEDGHHVAFETECPQRCVRACLLECVCVYARVRYVWEGCACEQ